MNYYYAVDGDDIGAEIEKYLFNNDIKHARHFSQLIEEKLNNIRFFFESWGGEVIDYPERRHCCGFGFRQYLVDF